MRVSTRIAAGYGVLILLTVAVLSYQVLIIKQLNQINRELADENVGQVSKALAGLKLHFDQILFEDIASKFVVAQDLRYRNQFQGYVEDIENDLANLETGGTSEKERIIIDRLRRSLHDLQARSEKPRPRSSDPPEWF